MSQAHPRGTIARPGVSARRCWALAELAGGAGRTFDAAVVAALVDELGLPEAVGV